MPSTMLACAWHTGKVLLVSIMQAQSEASNPALLEMCTSECASCRCEGILPWLFLCLCSWPSSDSWCLLAAAEDVVSARAHFHGLRVARPEEALCIAEDGLVIGSGSDCSAKLSSDKVSSGFPPATWAAWAALCAAAPCAFWQLLRCHAAVPAACWQLLQMFIVLKGGHRHRRVTAGEGAAGCPGLLSSLLHRHHSSRGAVICEGMLTMLMTTAKTAGRATTATQSADDADRVAGLCKACRGQGVWRHFHCHRSGQRKWDLG